MAANYKQANVNASTYQRAKSIFINNALGFNPYIEFKEETVITLPDGKVIKGDSGQLVKALDETSAKTVFNLIDSSTGAVKGTAKFQDVYDMLFSLYLHMATARDLEKTAVTPVLKTK